MPKHKSVQRGASTNIHKIGHGKIHKKSGGGVKKGKISKVMNEFSHHELHSGSKNGPVVTNRKQAIAIALSEARRNKK